MLFHYSGHWQPQPNMQTFIDGTVERNKPVKNHEDYQELKRFLAEYYGVDPNKLTLTSLSVIFSISDYKEEP